MLYTEAAGEHTEKRPLDNIYRDTKAVVEGELESGGHTRRDSQLFVTDELPSPSF